MSDNGRIGDIGDIQPKLIDPVETYFDHLRQGIGISRKKFIVAPEWKPCKIEVPPGGYGDLVQKLIDAQQQMLECHTVPRLWQLLMDFWVRSQCGTYFVKNPNWVEPPVTAAPFEVRNDTAVAVGLTNTSIATLTVPDRMVGTLLRFGHSLTDTVEFANVIWTIAINQKPVFGYQDFRLQLGTISDPRPLACHIPLKHGDDVRVFARTGGAAVSANVRLQGYLFPLETLAQTGDYTQWHTQ